MSGESHTGYVMVEIADPNVWWVMCDACEGRQDPIAGPFVEVMEAESIAKAHSGILGE